MLTTIEKKIIFKTIEVKGPKSWYWSEHGKIVIMQYNLKRNLLSVQMQYSI